MKTAIAQMDIIAGRPDLNVQNMIKFIQESKDQSIDLVIFPEMSVGGYLVGDKWLEDDFINDLMSYNNELKEASKGIAIIYGNVYVDKKNKGEDGRCRKYNCVYAYQNEKAVKKRNNYYFPDGIHAKTLLPNYRFFDDKRYFYSLKQLALDINIDLKDLEQPFVFELNSEEVLIGAEVCEDLWCEDYLENGKPVNITKMLIENGAEMIINISASPWTYGKNSARDRRIAALKTTCNDNFVPFIYANCVGVQNNGKNFITFDGGSTVYNKDGKIIVMSKETYIEKLIVFDSFDSEIIKRPEQNKIKEKYDAIIRGLRHIKDIFGSIDHPKFIIGLSGGVDSSVVCALLVKAFGKDKVIGVNMPTKYNSQKTKDAAKFLADKLDIEYLVMPIGDIVDANCSILESDNIKLSELNEENVQAKIRGTSILSNLAGKYSALFTNNGNKLEIALGYATLYGDVGGAVAPLGDLTKVEVIQMAKFLNNKIFGEEVVPEKMLPDELWRFGDEDIVPSAELKNEQIDPMKFGYHCALIEAICDYKKVSMEKILEWYLEEILPEKLNISKELFDRWELNDPKLFIEDLEWFFKSIQNNVFKRVQAPPIIITSKSAYGYDIRESQLPFVKTKKYEELKKEVLNNAIR